MGDPSKVRQAFCFLKREGLPSLRLWLIDRVWFLLISGLATIGAFLFALVRDYDPLVVYLAVLGAPTIVLTALNQGSSYLERRRARRPRERTWIERVAAGDRVNPPLHICEPVWVHLGNLGAASPYIEFRVVIYNGSVYPCRINRRADGRVMIGGEQLKDIPEIAQITTVNSPIDSVSRSVEEPKIGIDRGRRVELTIRQYLTEIRAKMIQEAHEQDAVQFNLTKVNFELRYVFDPDVPYGELGDQHLGPVRYLPLPVVSSRA